MKNAKFAWCLGVLGLLGLGLPTAAHAQESRLAELRQAAQGRGTRELLELGRSLRRAGHFSEAARTLSLIRNGPQKPEALWELARVRFDEVNFRGAQTACNALPQGRNRRDPAGLMHHVCMARAHIVWHRVALADGEIQIAERLSTTEPEMLLVAADARRLASDVAHAEELYRQAAAGMPTRADPYLGLGLLYETSRRLDDAETAYRRAVEVDGLDPGANLALGRFLLAVRGDHAHALPLLQKASQERPDWPEALVALGDAQLASGDARAALTAFEATVRLQETMVSAYRGLGRAQLSLGEWTAAEASLKHAIEQVANDAEAHAALAEVYAHGNRGEEALSEWQRVIDLSPTDLTPRFRAAQLAHELGQNAMARAHLLRILSDDGQNAQALLLQADIAFEENDRPAARVLYQQALDGRGDIDRARCQARLTELNAPPGSGRRR